MHIHNFVQLWYVRRGSIFHSYNGIVTEQKQGSIFIVPPYFEHGIDAPLNSFDLLACDFSQEYWRSVLGTLENNLLFMLTYLTPLLMNLKSIDPCMYFSGRHLEEIECLLGETYDEYQNEKTLTAGLEEKIKSLLRNIVMHYESSLSEENRKIFEKYHTAILTTFEYINEHYTEKIRYRDICREALMSSTAFNFIFKQLTGKTLIKYVYLLRVLRACELLESTDMTMYEIADICGFGDAVNFCRVFNNITGYQPSVIRKLRKPRKQTETGR
jgi:AraC-like DNA-binding protein